MFSLTEPERQLLNRLAAEGKATRLYESDLPLAKALEAVGLLFLIGQDEPLSHHAKGRHILAELRVPPVLKPPSKLLE